MEQDILNSDVAKEVLTILMYCDEAIQDKIPEDFIKKLTSLAAESNIEVNLVKDKPLNEQDVSEDALDTFALIYYLYVSNEEEKDKILSSWVINDEKNNE